MRQAAPATRPAPTASAEPRSVWAIFAFASNDKGGEPDSRAINAGACSRKSSKQLRLEFVIAKALAGQMNEIKGWIEAADRALEHCALVRPPESPRPISAAVNR